MANPDKPRGFWPYGKVKTAIPMEAGSTVYPGEFVSLANDGQVDASATGATIFGLALQYGVVGDTIMISCDPEQLYVGQADETEIDAQTDIGNNCDIVATAGSSTFRESRQEVDSSTIGVVAAQLTILGVEKRADNVLGTNVDVIVRINEHQVNKDAFAGI